MLQTSWRFFGGFWLSSQVQPLQRCQLPSPAGKTQSALERSREILVHAVEFTSRIPHFLNTERSDKALVLYLSGGRGGFG